jgi:alpha-beta hydrolase superfamily lysophospholipase
MTMDATFEAVRSADGTQIAFDRAGTGPALILVDAALGFRGFGPMGALAAELASSFTAIRYDRRGRGESTDTPPYAVEREVEDLQALVEAAGGSAFAYGFSSGAVLLLHAALAGIALPKLALLEPPLALEDERDESDLGAEVAELVAAGRRGDAVEHFNKSIGVPEEMLAGMRDAAFWPTLEQAAHTLVYDTTLMEDQDTLLAERAPTVTAPVLLLDGGASPPWAAAAVGALAGILPHAERRTLPGQTHEVAPDALAPALEGFFGVAARV